MIIHHLAPGPFAKYRGKIFSPLASVRLRGLAVAPHLARLGHKVKVVPTDGIVEAMRRDDFLDADLYLVHKTLYDLSSVLDVLRDAGKRVVVDVCDNIAAAPHLMAHYPSMLERADAVTVSSEALAELVGEVATVPVVQVPDCVELARGEPAFPASASPVRLLWFGRSGNAAPLLSLMSDLTALARETPCRLEVVCDATDGFASALERAKGSLAVDLTPWSPEALEGALLRCHAVLLPSSDEPAMATKSANRLQEALWAGRIPVAHPTRSHQAFRDSAVVTSDLVDGLRWVLAHGDAVLERIAAGQAAVAARFTPEAVARDWDGVVREVVERPTTPRVAPRPLPVRLNLGCGDKLLPGYVNVDIADNRAGVRPDVVCDLHRLGDFADDSVDEILAVHVVEHFWRWEVEDILREWVRVLKPGGRMVLECPNLRSACEAFLKDPNAFGQADARGQHTMWVFYGDPQWRDPLMVHRWGYTPETLMQVMERAGLTDLRREPAQFKLGDPRDMRVVGCKPQ
ncbi:methyltransferase domain-containing protein [Azospirillum sp. ST 5-10]|uniref:methyltransferase domain-containing protein n=1 Tax=unclassified Azospirillum TaxID=2630922 RepID=UPI003F4A3180